jgi:hypothetical protein
VGNITSFELLLLCVVAINFLAIFYCNFCRLFQIVICVANGVVDFVNWLIQILSYSLHDWSESCQARVSD